MGHDRTAYRHWIGVLLAFAATAAAAQPVTNPLAAAAPISGAPHDYDPLLAATAQARIVLLGEATHGTSEFYRERARITLRLIREQGFDAVAIEADAPEAERVNRYVRGLGDDRTADQALADFTRFPRWMWRNVEFRDFIEALRAENLTRPPQQRVGLYGIDLYDLYGALDRVGAYARGHASRVTRQARDAARCFSPYRRSTEAYGVATRQPARSCQRQAAALLAAMRALPPVVDDEEERFAAVRNAEAVVAGEAYLRAAYVGAYSWNVRERSMAAALQSIASHTHALGGTGKLVVWAHNTHVGSAQNTEQARRGETSIAGLLRATMAVACSRSGC